MAGLLKRLKDVISSEAHDMIDSHESPDRIARQLVREATDKVSAAQKLTIDAVAMRCSWVRRSSLPRWQ